jgi:hypothetical protein
VYSSGIPPHRTHLTVSVSAGSATVESAATNTDSDEISDITSETCISFKAMSVRR